MASGKKYSIAIVGCGTVGGATALLLTRDRDLVVERSGVQLHLKHIADLDFTHAESLGIDSSLFTRNVEEVAKDPEVDIAVELIGGTTIAKTVTEGLLDAGKHVVTANKALLAHHGSELIARARKNGVSLSFEASCGGGIPLVRALYDGLIANRIDALYGIVNGTCNYILTSMITRGRSYDEALKRAQVRGLAEADPTLDVSGVDSAHKLAIMASLAFGQGIDFDSIPVEGIDTLKEVDVSYGRELGYIIKLLAIAQRADEGFFLRVRPSFIALDHPLAWISGPFNAVSVYGHAVGHTMYYGRGAGGSPTASAVVADIVATAVGSSTASFEKLGLWPDLSRPANILPEEQLSSRYYIRVTVVDRPGVFAQLAAILGKHQISISSVLQKEPPVEAEGSSVPVVITTHQAREGEIRNALDEIDALEVSTEKSVCINIIDEHEETI